MIKLITKIDLEEADGVAVSEFMINCTDSDYQDWWPNVHLAFHTLERYPGEVGNLVYFDEIVGKRRLRFHARVTEYIAGERLVWQLQSVIALPAWITLEFQDGPNGVTVCHGLAAGYRGIGTVLDPFLKLYLSQSFRNDLDEHAKTEFILLAKKLTRNMIDEE